ncbi:PTS N-acetylmuramic acid transporter subunit IIBC [Vibrio fluvialis]|uniref:PTS N-acetylmuramic acid transporter subunit IIBC n=1 Tax=Vibrio fluvialis TaxID=676 RepID=UPI00192C5A33|nr:PTS N-acetylmuramic acid transporter subunit IIBC [Vibrio fluvialis]EKO3409954.1 PTS N-acetylmuramic acid transporter subunit IIBC [Vibrio fluvialis]EKO3536327.1 PTS N-acetylmuramic acid transporter subunit IIBC [Vibrio fluvialis]EKO3904967.1 PTS N-acetylmuramic acid transporter subunit IIBC [Vibrio fluvialis]ELP2651435.1 PTS N-acetylmuramic acid transporter subunit IIBC [Vibrio fluvialis]MBL4282701.1 PTS N-acetylmuramic acid transporter subunit IIBC [Vibrio fluvialis]
MAKISQTMISQILAAVGGSGNVNKCGNCMTRLRLTLANNGVADQATLKQIPGVMGVVESDEQFQIILGPGKAQQAADLMNQLIESITSGNAQPIEAKDSQDLSSVAAAQKKQMKSKQTSAVQRFLSKFATIFTPLIPGFIAAGLLLGFATLLEQIYVVDQTPSQFMLDLIAYMKVFGKGLFAFLSILIGYNAQQAFGGSGVNGAILASLFVLGYNPEATSGIYSGMSEFFGYTIDPRGNIIGVLLAAIIGAQVERKVREYMPDDLDMILTSVVTLLIMGVVTYVVIMPIGGELFKGMSWLFMNLNDNPLGAAVLAGLFLISVVFGIHQGFVPVYFALMEAQGFNSLFPILAMAGAGQVGASLALYFKANKDAVLRTQVKGAIIPGILGIGEPLIYGVTLPRVKPFVTACVGGAAGGFFIGLVSYLGLPVGLNTVFGPSGIVAIPLMTSNSGIFAGMAVFVTGLLISYVVGFIATYFVGSKNVDLS